MIARTFAWVLFLALAFGTYRIASAFKNPLNVAGASSFASPVLSQLPPASDGCAKNCLK